MKKTIFMTVLAFFLFVGFVYSESQVVGVYYKDTATGSAALAKTITSSGAWRLDSVRVHLNAVGAGGDLTVTLDAIAGAAYDVVLFTQDMTAVTDLVWIPDREIILTASDELDVAWANAGGKTYGLEVYYTRVY